MVNITRKDTVIVALSDLHSGGTTALFPSRFMQFEHTNHTPTDKQKEMFAHFAHCAEIIAKQRNKKRLIVIVDGDAIDGVHHGSLQIVTQQKTEQRDIHIDLMDFFLREVKFNKNKGDKLYYVTGTEIHVNGNENIIGEDLEAEKNGELYAFDMLDIEINGRRVWAAHHGTAAGKGANKGNALRNGLKNLYFDCLNEKITPPDLYVTGHVHDPFYETYNQWSGDDIHVLHGIILPSWQQKTRFAYKVAPTARNKIGLAHFEITAKGDILQPKFELMKDNRNPLMV